MKELPVGFMPPIPADAIPGLKGGAFDGLNIVPVGFGVNVVPVGVKLGALVFGLKSATLALIWGCPASGFLGMPLYQKSKQVKIWVNGKNEAR